MTNFVAHVKKEENPVALMIVIIWLFVAAVEPVARHWHLLHK